MTDVVISRCFGGFGLSPKAVKRYAELAGFELHPYTRDFGGDSRRHISWEQAEREMFCHYSTSPDLSGDDKFYFYVSDVERDDPLLVQVVREMGADAGSRFSKLEIVSLPDDVEWQIEHYDGNEWVAEKHRTW